MGVAMVAPHHLSCVRYLTAALYVHTGDSYNTWWLAGARTGTTSLSLPTQSNFRINIESQHLEDSCDYLLLIYARTRACPGSNAWSACRPADTICAELTRAVTRSAPPVFACLQAKTASNAAELTAIRSARRTLVDSCPALASSSWSCWVTECRRALAKLDATARRRVAILSDSQVPLRLLT